MTSGKFELLLRVEDEIVYQKAVPRENLPFTEALGPKLWAERAFCVVVSRGSREGRCDLLLGDERVVEIPEGEERLVLEAGRHFDDYIGEGSITVREEREGKMLPVFQITVPIVPHKISLTMCTWMIRDLLEIHPGFLFDFVSRSRLSPREIPGGAFHQGPEAELDRIERFVVKVEEGFRAIGERPASILTLDHEVRRYRSGTDLDTNSITWLSRHHYVLEGARPDRFQPRKILTRVRNESLDIYEHRILRTLLFWLIDRLEALAEQCMRIEEHLEEKRAAWDTHRRRGKKTVWEQDDLPRLERIREIRQRIRHLQQRLCDDIEAYPFLREAGTSELDLYPSQIFLNRPPYRRLYEEIRRFLDDARYRFDDSHLKYGIKRLSALFEYWCFVKVVETMNAILQQTPSGAFKMTHETYLPTPEPGQSFRYELDGRRWLEVTFNKEYLPKKEALRKGYGYGRAKFARLALRPDISIELWRPRVSAPDLAIILDAKFTRKITPFHWREFSDYSRLVYEFRTGRQFIRQRWLLYPGENPGERVLCNIPEYLQGKVNAPDLFIDGSIPVVPDERSGRISSGLEEVITRWAMVTGIIEGRGRSRISRGA